MAGAAWLLGLLTGQLFNCRGGRNIAHVLRLNLGVVKGDLPITGVGAGSTFVNITPPGQDVFGFVFYESLVNNFAIAGAEADEVLGVGIGFCVCNHGFELITKCLSRLFLRNEVHV